MEYLTKVLATNAGRILNLSHFSNLSKLPHTQPVLPMPHLTKLSTTRTLHRYQREAVAWMAGVEEAAVSGGSVRYSSLLHWKSARTIVQFDVKNRKPAHGDAEEHIFALSARGGILADEMGLGKTTEGPNADKIITNFSHIYLVIALALARPASEMSLRETPPSTHLEEQIPPSPTVTAQLFHSKATLSISHNVPFYSANGPSCLSESSCAAVGQRNYGHHAVRYEGHSHYMQSSAPEHYLRRYHQRRYAQCLIAVFLIAQILSWSLPTSS